jgi:hypothetical protein
MDGKMLALASILGMGLNLVGLLMLYRFAMPYQIRTGGADWIEGRQKDESAVKRERRYAKLASVGLVIACVGTALQAWSTAVQSKLL